METQDNVAPLVARVTEVVAARLEEIAAEAGVSYHTLYAWGRGRRNASSRHLMRLAQVVRHRATMLTELAHELETQAERSSVTAGAGAADSSRIGNGSGDHDVEPRRGLGGVRREFDSLERGGALRGWRD